MAANNFTHIALGKTISSLSNAAVIKYTHVADGSANNSAQFGVWGVTVITCLANGNVGIGTTAPSTTLQVSGTVNATTIQQDGSNITTLYASSNHSHDVASIASGTLPVTRGGTGVGSLPAKKLLSSSDGNVLEGVSDLHWTGTQLGIGTTVPSTRLTVVSGSSNILYLENNTGGIGSCANIVFGTWVGASNAVIGVVDENFSAHIRFLTRQPGSITNSQAERMRITNDGKLGIGLTNPTYMLDVKGDINFTGSLYKNGQELSSGSSGTAVASSTNVTISTTEGNTMFYHGSAGKHGQWENVTFPSDAGTNPFSVWSTFINEGAFIGINGDTIIMSSPMDLGALHYFDEDTLKLAFRIDNNGSIVAASDERIKEDIQEIQWDNVLDKVMLLKPVTYKYKRPETCDRDTCKFNKTHMGFIAQNVLEVFPDLVNVPDNPEEYMSLNYSMMTLPMLCAIQALNTKIDAQNTLINNLRTLVESLQSSI
jgi:hypothetical protein